MRVLSLMLLFVTACASAPTSAPAAPAREQANDPSAAPAPAREQANDSPAPPPASAPAPPLGPLPTGGIVLIGEIASPPSFDPKATLDTLKPQLLSCYNQARRSAPALRGKLKLRIN